MNIKLAPANGAVPSKTVAGTGKYPQRLKPIHFGRLAARLNSLVKKARFVIDSAETVRQCLKAVLILLPVQHE